MSKELYLADPIAPGAKQTREVFELLWLFGSLTTSELEGFGIEHPPARIHDLREKYGKPFITTKMVQAESHDGRIHRIGLYTLNEEARHGH